ncbi:uncharacterized protein EDB93DRAFT_1245992 [Suillus bovinus]|uniref:uncharacterized protein n=1 Tax=Suillus bovinus TaxID=48563 RepID=UPI001B865172|nr:uncharacterized protein EDB93DRAFT_1245992 [Suillus bovinus]KAG2158756.1 hypothetical protein EDB93DRAFT_1245992 [Suillus bovinus]
MSCALEAHLAWISAHDWVLQRLEDEEDMGHGASKSVVVDEVLDLLEHLPRDVDLKGFGAQTSLRTPELLPLLADMMVNGRVLDALIAAINDHADEHNDTAVETLDFSNILFLGDTWWSKYHFDKAFTQLHHLGDSLHNGTIQRIIFSVNITDSFSCAITALNTIKHTVFNHHPLFTDDSKYCLRMEEFLMLTKSHFESEELLSESLESSFADDTSDFSIKFLSCPPSYPSLVPATSPSPPPTTSSSERVSLNLRVREEDKYVGLFKYFPTTMCEEHLKLAWTPFSWELESHERDAHRVHVEGVERDICRREGNREWKQIQHAREKAVKKATTNHTSNIAPALPMTDLAEVSHPYRKI